jgi:DNA-binding transcriptional LysR family regulator
MNLTSLKYFLELAKDLNMTATAQRLYISQQNLTQHIQRLEKYYNVPLFHRKPKLSLTYAGALLYESAHKILEEEKALINQFSEISEKGLGVLRIGMPSYRAQSFMPMVLQKFYKKWPNITIEMTDVFSEKLEQMLFTNELDLFIGILPYDDSRLEIITLLHDKIFLVASDSLLQKYYGESFAELKSKVGKNTEIKTFKDLPFLMLKAPSRLRRAIDQCFIQANIKPKVFFEAMTTDMILPLYPYDFGAIFCTRMRLDMLKKMFSDVNAYPIVSNDRFIYHRLVLAYHKDQPVYAYKSDFIEIIRDIFLNIEKNSEL